MLFTDAILRNHWDVTCEHFFWVHLKKTSQRKCAVVSNYKLWWVLCRHSLLLFSLSWHWQRSDRYYMKTALYKENILRHLSRREEKDFKYVNHFRCFDNDFQPLSQRNAGLFRWILVSCLKVHWSMDVQTWWGDLLATCPWTVAINVATTCLPSFVSTARSWGISRIDEVTRNTTNLHASVMTEHWTRFDIPKHT